VTGGTTATGRLRAQRAASGSLRGPCTVSPPSTTRICRVVKDPAGEARHATVSAISVGRAKRPRGSGRRSGRDPTCPRRPALRGVHPSRRHGGDPDLVGGHSTASVRSTEGGGQDVRLDLAGQEVVRRLLGAETFAAASLRHPPDLDDLGRGHRGGAECTDLALGSEVGECAERHRGSRTDGRRPEPVTRSPPRWLLPSVLRRAAAPRSRSRALRRLALRCQRMPGGRRGWPRPRRGRQSPR
jgi:hypothetical protein